MGKRLARVMVSAELVEDAFTGAMPDGVWVRRDAGLPEGAKLVSCDFYLDCATPEVMLTFEHESFRELAEGEAVPLVGCEHQPRWTSWSGSVSLDTKAVIDCAVKAAVESIYAPPHLDIDSAYEAVRQALENGAKSPPEYFATSPGSSPYVTLEPRTDAPHVED